MAIDKKLIHYYTREDGTLWREAGAHEGPRAECSRCPEITDELRRMDEILAEEEAEKPILHEWAMDEHGPKNYGVDPHTGPACVRCEKWDCEFCNPEFLTEACPEQTEKLF